MKGLGERMKYRVGDISERTFCLQCEGESNKVQMLETEATKNSTKG